MAQNGHVPLRKKRMNKTLNLSLIFTIDIIIFDLIYTWDLLPYKKEPTIGSEEEKKEKIFIILISEPTDSPFCFDQMAQV